MSLFSRTGRRLERLEGEHAETRTGLQNELAEIAQGVKELRERQLPNFEQHLALQNERDEYAASDEVLRQDLDAANSSREGLVELLDGAQRSNEELRTQLRDTERVVNKLVQAVTTSKPGDVQREAARVIVENAELLWLYSEQRNAAEALLPRVTVTALLTYGRTRSVHRSLDDAKAAAGGDAAGWFDVGPVSAVTGVGDMKQATVTLPVNSTWTDRTSIRLVFNAKGIPVAAYGSGPQRVDDGHRVETFAIREPADAAAA